MTKYFSGIRSRIRKASLAGMSILMLAGSATAMTTQANAQTLALTMGANVGTAHTRATHPNWDYASTFDTNVHYIGGVVAYCFNPVRPTVPNYVQEGNSAAVGEARNIKFSDLSNSNLLNLYAYFGYGYNGINTPERYAAAQELIWNSIDIGEITGQSLSGNWNVTQWTGMSGTHNNASRNAAIAEIQRLASTAGTRASFNGTTHNLRLNEEIVLTDTNNVLRDYNVVPGTGVSATISGNQLRLRITSANFNPTLTLEKKRNTQADGQVGAYLWHGTTLGQSVVGTRAPQAHLRINKIELPNTVINLRLAYGDLTLSKENTSGQPVQGVTFRIATNNTFTQNVRTGVTNAQGKVTFSDIEPGTWYYQETAAPADYIIDNTIYNTQVAAGSVSSPNAVVNRPTERMIDVYKYNDDGELLPGAVFELLNASGTVVDTKTTDANGYLRFVLPTMGVYRIREKSAPTGYTKSSDVYTSTQSNVPNQSSHETTEFTNTKQYGRITIQKIDPEQSDGNSQLSTTVNEAGFAGTQFRVQLVDPFFEGDVYNSITTVARYGTRYLAIADNLPLGRYRITETRASQGHVISTEERFINLVPNGANLTFDSATNKWVAEAVGMRDGFANNPILAPTNISKVSDNGYNITDARFEIERDDGVITGESFDYSDIRSDSGMLYNYSSGSRAMLDVLYGNYILRETKAAPGFYITPESYETPFTVLSGVPVNISVENVPQSSKINVRKIDVETGVTARPGLTFGGATYQIIFRSATFPEIKNTDPRWSSWTSGQVVDTITTDASGFASTTVPLAIGVYDIVEVTPSRGYQKESGATRIETLYDGSAYNGIPSGRAVSERYTVLADNRVAVAAQINAHNQWLNDNLDRLNANRQPVPNITVQSLVSNGYDPIYLSEAPELGRIEINKTYETVIPQTGQTVGLPEEGAEFDVFDARGQLVDQVVTNDEGYATTKYLPIGEYRIVQTKGPEGWYLAESTNITIASHMQSAQANILNELITSRLRLIKKDIGTGETINLAGVTFELYTQDTGGQPLGMEVLYPEEAYITQFKTNAQGVAVFPAEIPNGKYYLQEIVAPEGYYLDPNGARIEIVINGLRTDVTVGIHEEEIMNVPQYGQLLIDKTGDLLVGWDTSNITHNGENVLDANGVQQVLNTPRFEESYLAGAVFSIKATEDIMSQDRVTKFFNAGDEIARIRTTQDGNLVALSGSWMWNDLISKVEQLTVDTVVTQSRNEDAIRGYAVPLGKYSLEEVEAPSGYKKSDEVMNFELKPQVQTVRFDYDTASVWNDKQSMKFKFTKGFENAQWHEYHQLAPEQTLFGLVTEQDLVVNGITLPAGSIVAKSALDANLQGSFASFFEGTYLIRELVTNEAYILASDVGVEFTYNPDAPLETESEMIEIQNELKSSTIQVVKIDSETGEYLGGAVFKLSVIKDDGSEVEIGEFITNELGQLDLDLEYGNYKLYEVKAPKGYVNDGWETIINVDGSESVIALPEVENKQTETTFSKIDITDSEELPGAHITVIDKETGEVVESWISGDEPHIIKKLEVGKTYIMREDLAPIGYVTASEIEFTVSESGVDKITMIDDITKLEITKIDKLTGEMLSGVTLQILDMNGNVYHEFVTNGQAEMITKIPVGSYILREISAPAGYVLASDIPFEIKDSAEVHKVLMVNTPTTVIINKVDGDSKLFAAGAQLELVDADGNVVATWISGDEGHTIHRLAPGKYTIREIAAPKGYDVLTEAVEIEVLLVEKAQNFEVVNWRRLLNVEIVKQSGNGEKQLLDGALFKVEEINAEGELTGRVEYHRTGKLNINGPANAWVLLSRTRDFANAERLKLSDIGHLELDRPEGEYFYKVEGTDEVRRTQVKKGMAYLFQVKYGWGYRITELEAPEGYWVGTQPAQTFVPTAAEGTETIEYIRINDMWDVPVTGDNTNIAIYGGIFGMSSLTLALYLLISKRKEEELS